MSTPVDPSWLPSTVAQSTAALVGIIGGLLVARFMSIDSEQKSLRARRAEAQERLEFAAGVRDGLDAAADRKAAIDALCTRSVVEVLATPPPEGPLPTEEFLDAAEIDGWPADHFEPFLTEARQVIHDCGQGLIDAVTAENGESESWLPVRRALRLVEDEWDELREQFHSILQKARKKQLELERSRQRSRFGVSFPDSLAYTSALNGPDFSGLISPAESAFAANTRAAANARRVTARDEVTRAKFEFDLADRALRGAALPGSLMTAVWTLTALTLVGLVLPVIALFALPSYDSYRWRLVVLVAFCIGIAALLTYLFVSARRLQPNDPAPDRSTSTQPSTGGRPSGSPENSSNTPACARNDLQ